MTTILAKSRHDYNDNLRLSKSMIRLSDDRQKVIRGDLLDHFSLMTIFLPESCQNKMTTYRLS